MNPCLPSIQVIARRTILPVLAAVGLVSVAPPAAAVPTNDNLANAQAIPAGPSFSVSGIDSDATTESFEAAPNYPFAVDHTVWFSWTPTVSGYLYASAISAQANEFANLAVFKGPTPGASTFLSSSYATNAIDSTVHVDAGQLYFICVGSDHATGGFTLTGKVTAEPGFFNGEAALSTFDYYLSFANGNYFGYYHYFADAHYIYHYDLGYEYIFDGNDSQGGVYMYDFASSDFFYTSQTFGFPYLYDFNLKAVLYYYPDSSNPDHYNTKGVRYFYNFATGTTITK